MRCRNCLLEYPQARKKGPYCSLRCAYIGKLMQNSLAKPGATVKITPGLIRRADESEFMPVVEKTCRRPAILKVDPSKLPKPLLPATRPPQLRNRLTPEEMALARELEPAEGSPAKQFHMIPREEYIERCRRGGVRKYWNEERDRQLMELKEKGLKWSDIARRMGKTQSSVINRMNILRKAHGLAQ